MGIVSAKVTKARLLVNGKEAEMVDHDFDFSAHEGEEIEVYIVSKNPLRVSYEKAKFIRDFERITAAYNNNSEIEGVVIRETKDKSGNKTGYIVHIGVVEAYLPESESCKLTKAGDISIFKVKKVNNETYEIIVSWNLVAKDRISQLDDGVIGTEAEMIVTGVKNYGLFGYAKLDNFHYPVFVPIGMITNVRDADLSCYLGKTVKIKIVEINKDCARLTGELIKKALEIKVGDEVTGIVTHITDYGYLVQILHDDQIVKGLIHKNQIWCDFSVKVGDKVTAVVVGVNNEELALGIRKKQKWNVNVGDEIEVTPIATTSKGMWLSVEKKHWRGFMPMAESSWDGSIPSGKFKAKVIAVNSKLQTVTVSAKRLLPNPMVDIKINQEFNAVITEINSFGIRVKLPNGVIGFIPKSRLSQQYNFDKVYVVGQAISCRVVECLPDAGKLILTEVGKASTSLGDVLKNALKK